MERDTLALAIASLLGALLAYALVVGAVVFAGVVAFKFGTWIL